MTEPSTEPITEPTDNQEPLSGPTTDRFKDDPTYKAMASQLADLQREKQERVEAEEKARKEAEIKDLESKGEYEKAIKARDEEIERVKSQHAKDILERDLKNELLKTGFTNDKFVRGAIADYSADSDGDLASYVQALASDESNKPFLTSGDSRTVHAAPGRTPVAGGSIGWDQVKADLESPDRQTRIAARAKITAHREKTGEYPFD